MTSVLKFLRDFHYALGDGFDLAIKLVTPVETRVRVYEYWKQANEPVRNPETIRN